MNSSETWPRRQRADRAPRSNGFAIPMMRLIYDIDLIVKISGRLSWELKIKRAGAIVGPIVSSAQGAPNPVHDLNVPYEDTEEFETPTADSLFSQTPLPGTAHTTLPGMAQTPLPGTAQTPLTGSDSGSLYNIATGSTPITPNENTFTCTMGGVPDTKTGLGRPSPYMQPTSPLLNQRPPLDVNVAYVEGREEGERGAASNQPSTQAQEFSQQKFVPGGASPSRIPQSWDSDRFHFLQQERTTAETIYDKNPLDADNLERWGVVLLELAQIVQCQNEPYESIHRLIYDAIQKLSEAFSINSNKHDALYYLGTAYISLAFQISYKKNYEEYFQKASHWFKLAAELEPENELYQLSLNIPREGRKLYAEVNLHCSCERVSKLGPSSYPSIESECLRCTDPKKYWAKEEKREINLQQEELLK